MVLGGCLLFVRWVFAQYDDIRGFVLLFRHFFLINGVGGVIL